MGSQITRQSNLELLRIISMLMIVGLHYMNETMGGALRELKSGDFNYYIAYFLESMMIVGVNTFILITGYFQINKSSIKLNKVVELLVTMVVYGFVFYFIALAFGWVQFSIVELVKSVVPILAGLKWFIKVFIILYLLIPFINAGLNNLDKKKYQIFLVVMFLFFSVYPSALPFPPVTDNGYGIITFVLLYAIGGYIKKFYNPNKSKSLYLSGYLVCGLITYAFSLIVPMVLPEELERVWGYNFVFNMIGSVFLFLFFMKLNIVSTKINYIASFAIGVYFVHTSPVLYDFMYGSMLQTDKFWHSPYFIIHAIMSIFLVYAISTVIDIARNWLFDKSAKIVVPIFKKYLPILWKQIP